MYRSKRALWGFAAAFAFLASGALAQSTVTQGEDRGYQPMRSTSNVGAPVATEAECEARILADGIARQQTYLYKCRHEKVKLFTWRPPVVVCPAAPAASTVTNTCAPPLLGTWTQTLTTVVGAPPGCVQTVTRSPESAPAGACTSPPAPADWTPLAAENASFTVPDGSTVRYGAGTAYAIKLVSGAGTCSNTFFQGDPAREVLKTCDRWTGSGTPPAPTVGGSTGGGGETPPTNPPATTPVTYYFSPNGVNSNVGTEIAPKRDLTGINVASLAAGSRLFFERGGSYPWASVILMGRGTLAAPYLVVDSYGTGELPVLNTTTGSAMSIGMYSGEANRAGNGFIIRNVELRGTQQGASRGIYFVTNVDGVLVENVKITNFNFGIDSTCGAAGSPGVQNVTIRNSSISRNSSIGILGQMANSTIEGNLFEGNNFGGSGFEHGTYLSGNGGTCGHDLVIRNNRYSRNSVNVALGDGFCRGGNMTFHGMMNNVTIEGNTIEQERAVEGCWLMSITQGYATPEGFTNFQVRNNRLINGGNNAMNAQSAPGILIEGNVIINRNATNQIAISAGHTDYPNGDLPDGDAVVRNNTICQGPGASGLAVVFTNNPRAVQSGNVVRTGADASTGVCAP